MSRKAADIINDQVKKKPNSVLGLATGGTMMGAYAALVDDYKQNGTSYQQIKTVNLDEYIGLEPEHPNSYHYYINGHFFNRVDIPKDQTYLPNGLAKDIEAECQHYESLIEQIGGMDLQLLGIGQNGHIGFNEPGTSFESTTHIVELASLMRQANSCFFNRLEKVPTHAITMGIATIMKSKKILLLVSGKKKAHIIAQLFTGKVTTQIPASILNTHPNVIVIADQEALSLLSPEKRKVYV
ncbi:glucosamine-6-phosphate deaminase [Anoxybacillus calidus]|uniref:Glucosamine-6-phosphate deaminase n=1 Tax=[Anoxybacillus] calidus TaxID=575178 RepID=A0A7W0BU19_9BACL|nr:glucosamine-6-phosphate deaminase [Anoxybacillus calidus]MBA2870100.1 glucosamine-6-phosphate deaminase [Anoxybacillus calidus]